MNDNDIEQEIQAKGLTAPRVTPADIEANIASEHYFTADQGARHAFLDAFTGNSPFNPDSFPPLDPALCLLTFCVLVLNNGYTCIGTSACASPENFDAEIGRKIAREKAVDDVYAVMGYALKEQLHVRDIAMQPPLTGSQIAG